MKYLFYILLFLPSLVFGQNNHGVEFEQYANWQQVKSKAQAEGKYIFVDVYATWCGPCKQMDREVYPSPRVASLTKDKFIAIKIQQDRSITDNAFIKTHYADAEHFAKEYSIIGLPSLLFFSPDGKLVDKIDGYRNENELIKMLSNVLANPNGYEKQLENYRNGQTSIDAFGALAINVKEKGNDQLADSIASVYYQNYLKDQNEIILAKAENIKFIATFQQFLNRSGDPYFKFFLSHPDIIIGYANNTIPVYSRAMVKYVIAKEEINDKLYSGSEIINFHPNWMAITRAINAKYGTVYSREIVPPAEILFYRKSDNWILFADRINKAINRHPPQKDGGEFKKATMLSDLGPDDWNLNSGAWDVFLHCPDKSVVAAALSWSRLSILLVGTDHPGVEQYLDTKANLLYKLDRKKEAIAAEKQAFKAAAAFAKKAGADFDGGDYLMTIRKMMEGKPTW